MYKCIVSETVSPELDFAILDAKDVPCERHNDGRPLHAQVVDQFDAQPFMQGENGFRRSDISIMFASESADVRQSIAARMIEIKNSSPSLADYSDSELAAMVIPRSCQSPETYRNWLASLDKSGIAKSVDAYVKDLESKAAKDAEVAAKLAELEAIKSKPVEPKNVDNE